MIAREEARLRTLFRRLLLVSVATSPLACSSADSGSPPDAAPGDATAHEPDASHPADGGLDATTPDHGDTGLSGDPYGFDDAACDPTFLDGSLDEAGCDFLETLPCGLPAGAHTEGCYVALTQCAVLCNQTSSYQRVCGSADCINVDGSAIPSTTPLTLYCSTGLCAANSSGRRPEGLEDASPTGSASPLGAALAAQAWLEAASVHAFRQVGAELTSLRAPRSLVRWAERSAQDEARHARVIARLARRHGAAPARVTIRRRARARSLEAFAIENAVEGCVRESFGALMATRQASHAADRELAHKMAGIADDETRHAALAWEIARWTSPRLSTAARARVRRATYAALSALRTEVARTPADLAHALGVPTGREAMALLDAFETALFGERSTSRH